MKSKKVLSFALIMVAVLCFAFIPNTSAMQNASAEEIVLTKIVGYNYNRKDILDEAGVSAEGHYIEYRYSNYADGAVVGENDLDSKGVKYEGFKQASSTIEFTAIGTYLFQVKATDENGVVESSFKVETKPLSIDGSVKYDLSATSLQSYKESINKVVSEANENKGLKVGDSFTLPKADELIKSDFFPYSALRKTIYYCASNATTYTSTTSDSFKVNTLGQYSFYIIPSDPCQIGLSTEDLAVGPKGWYKTDDDGKRLEGDENLVIPIFTFNVGTVSLPSVSVETVEVGFIGLDYDIDCFNINATNYDVKYSLYYTNDGNQVVDSYEKAIALTEITDTEIFDASGKKFSPKETGYYYVTVRLVDGNNNEVKEVSGKISVLGEFASVELENEYVRNNWLSIVFLCISLACLIAIIVIIVVDRVKLSKAKELTLAKKNNK